MVLSAEGPVFCSLVIPCYNEGENITPLVTGFAGALDSDDFELIIVDNGSGDSSSAILGALAPRFPFLRVVSVPENMGYGYGITQGLKAARGRYAGWAHGDMQYSPVELMKAVESLRFAGEAKIFLKGLRSARPPAETIFTAGMAVFESLLFAAPLWDINAQPTLFHRSLLEYWAGAPADFSLDLYAYALAKKKGFVIKRLPLSLSERSRGRSSWNRCFVDRLRLVARTIKSSLNIRRALFGLEKDVSRK
ncbi:MAG: hypothetical protein A2X34_10215 [Elusimicrobia bacterium GWC2_51_8]|nr:MAG: hypothetical protein A2X33_01505 [Elusimicrobia bacterium GWA2_51_34]OGR61781.1 MAG: hypothetical protein A2X34_10215 [Elusimicrobia bacterium GWC2_51_8]OGR86377.1 MAG: hypothetical protein A2021_07170 [Elusimicrobia bacterium GWF2_52_66]HAF96204.1 glycosyl transferase family 2 [Elusimicrobiota bacterium]HCE97815.1 glycosyl transferase family 2 [Elusimicrobiota bacterium]